LAFALDVHDQLALMVLDYAAICIGHQRFPALFCAG
jgi:hypothetical protein